MEKWGDAASSMPVLTEAEYPFPKVHAKFMGYIIQKYRPRRNSVPSAAFQQWIDKIQIAMGERLIPSLVASSMMLPFSAYQMAGFDPTQPIVQMSDFNSLIGFSQEHQVPIYALTDQQLGQVGTVLESSKESMKRFKNLFSDAADRLIYIIDHAASVRPV